MKKIGSNMYMRILLSTLGISLIVFFIYGAFFVEEARCISTISSVAIMLLFIYSYRDMARNRMVLTPNHIEVIDYGKKHVIPWNEVEYVTHGPCSRGFPTCEFRFSKNYEFNGRAVMCMTRRVEKMIAEHDVPLRGI